MSLDRTSALIRHNVRLLLADPAPIVVITLMPLVLIAFLQGTGRAVLESEGLVGVTGAEQVVPGMTVLFAFFGVTYLGVSFFAEHGWGTWDRLRSSGATLIEILVGKLVPGGLVLLGQMATQFTIGALIFDLRFAGSVIALAAMMLTMTTFLVGLSLLCVAVFRTINQLSAAANVGGMAFAGLGGALAPMSVMPEWAQSIAPSSPAYWALQGFRALSLDGADLGGVARPVGMLLLFSAAAVAVAFACFRSSDEKVYTP